MNKDTLIEENSIALHNASKVNSIASQIHFTADSKESTIYIGFE